MSSAHIIVYCPSSRTTRARMRPSPPYFLNSMQNSELLVNASKMMSQCCLASENKNWIAWLGISFHSSSSQFFQSSYLTDTLEPHDPYATTLLPMPLPQRKRFRVPPLLLMTSLPQLPPSETIELALTTPRLSIAS